MNRRRQWKMNLLTGAVTAVISQIYWNIFLDDFRVSLAVAILPILLTTINKEESSLATCGCVSCMVFLFRWALAIIKGQGTIGSIQTILPGALFFLCYGLLFEMMVENKYTASVTRLTLAAFGCDFISNLFETLVRSKLFFTLVQAERVLYLFEVAAIRTIIVVVLLILLKSYRTLLTKEEHEKRYQRLFLMTTSLKTELYFMRKNTENVETIMGNAYHLYEMLSDLDVPQETQKLSLAIARDVHEIKKDYLRIIQGIEKEVDEQYPEKKMHLKDILNILQESTYRMMESKSLDIKLDFRYQKDFLTDKHYSLMAILKNLENNAIEAIASVRSSGLIEIFEQQEGDSYVFSVRDDGPGIAEKNLTKIFQMGFSTKFDKQTGNIYRGVGLAGVKAAVEEGFHGKLEVRSALGAGTEFRITIPIASLEG